MTGRSGRFQGSKHLTLEFTVRNPFWERGRLLSLQSACSWQTWHPNLSGHCTCCSFAGSSCGRTGAGCFSCTSSDWAPHGTPKFGWFKPQSGNLWAGPVLTHTSDLMIFCSKSQLWRLDSAFWWVQSAYVLLDRLNPQYRWFICLYLSSTSPSLHLRTRWQLQFFDDPKSWPLIPRILPSKFKWLHASIIPNSRWPTSLLRCFDFQTWWFEPRWSEGSRNSW